MAEELFGYSRNDVIGSPLEMLLPETFSNRVITAVRPSTLSLPAHDQWASAWNGLPGERTGLNCP